MTSVYGELYFNRDQANHSVLSDAFLDHCILPALTEDAKNTCEGALTNAECFRALPTFPSGKFPGNDGLTANPGSPSSQFLELFL